MIPQPTTTTPTVRKQPKGLAYWLPISSTNGQNNLILMALFLLGGIFGIPEDTVSDIYLAAVPTLFLLIEAIKGAKRPSWTGNLLTYAFSALVLMIPALDGVIEALAPLAARISDGDFDLMSIFPFLVPLVNQLVIFFKTRKANAEAEAAAGATAGGGGAAATTPQPTVINNRKAPF